MYQIKVSIQELTLEQNQYLKWKFGEGVPDSPQLCQKGIIHFLSLPRINEKLDIDGIYYIIFDVIYDTNNDAIIIHIYNTNHSDYFKSYLENIIC